MATLEVFGSNLRGLEHDKMDGMILLVLQELSQRLGMILIIFNQPGYLLIYLQFNYILKR